MNFGTLGAGYGGLGRGGAGATSLAASALATYGGLGLAFFGADDSMSVVDATTPANNYSGPPGSKFTTTRAGATATYWTQGGVLATAPANTLRRDFDPRLSGVGRYLIELSKTNVVLWNRDLTNAAWTKTSCTAAKDQVGVDGVAASASSLTATGGNATCLQSITLGSSARFNWCFIKRITGSGVVEMTMDNGATWTAVTVTSAWTAVEIPTQTLANPTVGLRIVTSGDAIAVDYFQNENGTYRSSAIATTTAAVARPKDDVTLATSLFPASLTAWSMYAKFVALSKSTTYGIAAINNNNSTDRMDMRFSTGYSAIVTSGGVAQASLATASLITALTPLKMATRFTANDVRFAHSSATLFSADTSVTMPANMSLLRIGSLDGGTNNLDGWVEEFIGVPSALPDATLQILAT